MQAMEVLVALEAMSSREGSERTDRGRIDEWWRPALSACAWQHSLAGVTGSDLGSASWLDTQQSSIKSELACIRESINCSASEQKISRHAVCLCCTWIFQTLQALFGMVLEPEA